MGRWPYLALFFANAIVAAVVQTYGTDALVKIPSIKECDSTLHPFCVGNQFVYRCSSSIGILFAALLIQSLLCNYSNRNVLCICGSEVVMYLALIISSLFIPNDVFDVYSYVAASLSGIFIVMQIIILMDFAYNLRDLLLDKMDSKTQTANQRYQQWIWQFAYLFISICFVAFAISGVVVLYVYYSGCALNIVFNTITSVSILILIALSLASFVGAGLLPPGVICAYIVFLCWQAISKAPEHDCKPSFAQDKSSNESPLLVPSAIIAAFSLNWTCWRTSCATSALFRLEVDPKEQGPNPDKSTRINTIDTLVDIKTEIDDTKTIESSYVPKKPSWQFYFIMLCSSMFMAMVLTDWGINSGPYSNKLDAISMWVQIVSQWVTILIFTWTLIAPTCLPNRDFT